MLVILESGGLKGGGVNWDAKIRRNSTDLNDLFIAHISGMDVWAKALLVAHKILNDSDYRNLRKERYASFEDGNGKLFEKGKLKIEDLKKIALRQQSIPLISGKQERFEQILLRYL